jgi:CheY-like chemotaxis protein/HPt (histidine-containing phosphotransfer) domain-containing protein
VTDSGIGIPPDRVDRLFKSFSQVDASTTRKYGGTGLGLAICKQLTELMGGQIGVESTPGGGSTFWFTATFGVPSHAVQWAQPRIDPRGLKVLIVDQNPVHQEVFCSQLASWGLVAATASSGTDALDQFNRKAGAHEPFDVVIMDSTMRDMTLEAMARAIRQSVGGSDCALMMLAGMGPRMEAAELASRGLDGHISRPVRQSQLFDTIMNTIARRSNPSAPQHPSATTTPQRPAVRGARILLVEDNEVNQMVAAELLSEAGYVCDMAIDGRKAVEAVLRVPYGVVLMDCQMPEMDGFAAARLIRQHEANNALPSRTGRLPIVALTANAVKGDRERCLEAGMDDYLSKPLHPEKLVATIQSFLSRAVVAPPTAPSAAAPPDAPAPTTALAPAGSDAGPLPIDIQPLVYRCGGRRDFAGKVLEKFRVQSTEVLESIARGLGEKNGELATRSAHSLKGMAATISAESLRRNAAEAEARAHAQDWDELAVQLEGLRKELDACLAFIPSAMAPAPDSAVPAVKPKAEAECAYFDRR